MTRVFFKLHLNVTSRPNILRGHVSITVGQKRARGRKAAGSAVTTNSKLGLGRENPEQPGRQMATHVPKEGTV